MAADDGSGRGGGVADRGLTVGLEQLAALSGKPLKDEILASAFKNLSFTVDPIASSLYTSAQHAQDVGLLKPVDLKGIYDLTLLNEVLQADGQPAVTDAAS